MPDNNAISEAMTIRLNKVVKEVPTIPPFVEGIRGAPKRQFTLSLRDAGKKLVDKAVYRI